MKSHISIYGEIASFGYGEGQAIFLKPYQSYIPEQILGNREERKKEFERFKYFTKKTINKIKQLQNQLHESLKELLEIQIYFLKDPIFTEAVERNILIEGKNLALSIFHGSRELQTFFHEQASDFMKQRWIDFQDAIYQLLDEVLGISYIDLCLQKVNHILKNHSNEKYILISNDISPILYLKLPKPNGILLKDGSLSGHLTLLASNQGIPILIRAFPENLFYQIQDGDWIIIDTNKGKATIYKEYQQKKSTSKVLLKKKRPFFITKSNVSISLNADDKDIIQKHSQSFQISVGLFRTEFLYLKNPKLLYDVKSSLSEYKKIFSIMHNNDILTLRLIDIDEDKYSFYFFSSPENRGKRGIDYYKSEPIIIQNQIQSIIQAFQEIPDPNWTLRILIPMVATYDDWLYIKNLLEKEMEILSNSHKKHIQIGIMLEVPSILFTLPLLEQEIDFFSIGTNDLLSSFLGKKRLQIQEEDYYEPSFYRMLYISLKDTKKEISICGNLATKQEFLLLFYLCGIRNFSVPYGIYEQVYQFFYDFDPEQYPWNQISSIIVSKTKEEWKEQISKIKKL